MRSAAIFLAGLFIGLAVQSGSAQIPDIVRLNHVAIAVNDYAGATEFYAKRLGFREAFSFRDAGGSPYFTYFQINRETFLEVMQATPERPAGCPHFGLEVQNLDRLVERLSTAGVKVQPGIHQPAHRHAHRCRRSARRHQHRAARDGPGQLAPKGD